MTDSIADAYLAGAARRVLRRALRRPRGARARGPPRRAPARRRASPARSRRRTRASRRARRATRISRRCARRRRGRHRPAGRACSSARSTPSTRRRPRSRRARARRRDRAAGRAGLLAADRGPRSARDRRVLHVRARGRGPLRAAPAGRRATTRISIAHRRLPAEVGDLPRAARAPSSPDLPHAADAPRRGSRATTAPAPAWAAAFAGVLAELFADEGLVLIDPRDPALARRGGARPPPRAHRRRRRSPRRCAARSARSRPPASPPRCTCAPARRSRSSTPTAPTGRATASRRRPSGFAEVGGDGVHTRGGAARRARPRSAALQHQRAAAPDPAGHAAADRGLRRRPGRGRVLRAARAALRGLRRCAMPLIVPRARFASSTARHTRTARAPRPARPPTPRAAEDELLAQARTPAALGAQRGARPHAAGALRARARRGARGTRRGRSGRRRRRPTRRAPRWPARSAGSPRKYETRAAAARRATCWRSVRRLQELLYPHGIAAGALLRALLLRRALRRARVHRARARRDRAVRSDPAGSLGHRPCMSAAPRQTDIASSRSASSAIRASAAAASSRPSSPPAWRRAAIACTSSPAPRRAGRCRRAIALRLPRGDGAGRTRSSSSRRTRWRWPPRSSTWPPRSASTSCTCTTRVPHAASAYLARQVLGAAAPRFVTTLHGTDVTRVGAAPELPVDHALHGRGVGRAHRAVGVPARRRDAAVGSASARRRSR